MSSDTGYIPGVLEERTIARWFGVPCFRVGALKGFTANVEQSMARKFSEGNRFGDDEIRGVTERADDIDGAVGPLMEHLVMLRAAIERGDAERVGALLRTRR